MHPPRLLIEPARGTEVSKSELAARIFDSVAEHVERSSPLNFGGQTLEELFAYGRAVVLLELLPFLWLRGEDEIHRVAWQQAEGAVVVLRLALAIAAWRRV